MKIMLEANLDFLGHFTKKELELESLKVTLRSLLEEISKRYYEGRISFIDSETGAIDPNEYQVMVNSVSWDLLPKGIESELTDGDKVHLIMWLELLGGG